MDNFSKQMEMVLYHSNDGDVSINAYIKDDTLWITQKAMAKLLEWVYRQLINIFLISSKKESFPKQQLFPKWK